MKKIITAMLLSFASTLCWAQFLSKGSIIGNGSFSFETTKNSENDYKSSSFSIIPTAGYLVMDNLAVGASIYYTSSSGKSQDFSSSSNSISIGPVVRYYLNKGVFFHGLYTFGSSKNTYTYLSTESETKYGYSSIQVGVGYAARITDTVLFEPMVGYYSDTQKLKSDDSKSTTSGLFISGGFTIILKTGN